MSRIPARRTAALFLVAAAVARGDGPQDNLPDNVRPVPPPGVAVPAADREFLQTGVDQLGKEVEALRDVLKAKPALLELLPDVQIYHKAVHYALAYNEFFDPREVAVAKKLLEQGLERAKLLRQGQPLWATATGLVARGYVSKIDGSVQPYGLVVPASYKPNQPFQHRLDAWFHGRGEKLTELAFINQRQTSPGEFTPRDAFVLHPYGRYCNANKFAGEVDFLEALENVRRHYAIDENRVVVRGFSMGGAACWQYAVHYAGRWAAAAPGAGFSETPDFLKVFQNEAVQPPPWERTLWHLYDCTDYALNLSNCPTVAYSGENDRQKQAADLMTRTMAAAGLTLVHVIGPKTGHAYHPLAKEEINRRIDAIAARGRDPAPRRVRFTTWTLRYNDMLWVTVDALDRHWQRASVDAEVVDDNMVRLRTENVVALTLDFPPGRCPLDATRLPKVLLDGSGPSLTGGSSRGVPPVFSDRSWTAHFRKVNGQWVVADSADDGTLHKRHGLQGPIDDAFMDSFLMVRPTGKPLNDKVGGWAAKEMAHAVEHWRRQFRGDARVKDDTAVTDADVADHNLVLWGDPQSNQLLARIADKLPVRWAADGVRLGTRVYDAAHHVPVLIYPNPLNPRRYVVLNSGFTFREYDYLNNARQVPKLPDFAVLDVNVPVTSRLPGGVVGAGFFDERWQLPAGGE
jgi:pimeloyl-ACP methyl ester carboxylesterase